MFIKNTLKTLLFLCVIVFSHVSLSENLIKATHEVKSGDTLISILNKNYIKGNDIHELIYKTKKSENIKNLKIGQKIIIYKTQNGSLAKFILDLDNVNVFIAERKSDHKGFTIKKGKFKTNQVNQYVVGVVKYSVNKTLKKMGLNKEQRKEFQLMFGNKVDFKKIKKGTKFVAVYPEYYSGNKKLLTGTLLSAEISYGNRSSQIFTFNNFKGEKTYYLKNGAPTSEGIQRDPLESYTRVSSDFSPARMHPVLGKIRAHNGTDYAAKRGTPIFAAATGKVALKDTQRGYGNVIVIDHADGYSTLYAHMHKFKKDIYSGKRISKGDIIGYVGSTGISTGNHLHFEIRKNGKYLNPRKVDLPTGSKISKSDVDRFRNFTKKHREGVKLAKVLNKSEGKSKIAIKNKEFKPSR